MRKKFLYFPLSILLGTTLLASCSTNYKEENGNVITITTADGKSSTLSLKDVFNTQLGSSTAAQAYYNLLSDIYTFTSTPTTTQMNNTVDQDLETSFYEASKTNAKNNGTSVKEEQEKLLNAANVDTVEQYRDQKILQQKKDLASTNYYSKENMNSTLTEQFIKENAPYHVKHILVKTGSSTDAHRGTINKTEAQNIANVVERMGKLGTYDAQTGITNNGESFGQLAQNMSEDTGSAARLGDLGMLNIKAAGGSDSLSSSSFVNEFKLGLYAWDTLFNPKATQNTPTATSFPVTGDTKLSTFTSDNPSITDQQQYVLYGIPFSAAIALEYYSDIEKTPLGLPVQDATETNYPRNLIYNTYFNNHSLSVMYIDMDSTVLNGVSDYNSDDAKAKVKAWLQTTLLNNYAIANDKVTDTMVQKYLDVLKTYKDRTVLTTDGLKNKNGVYDYQWNKANVGSEKSVYSLAKVSGSHKILSDDQGKPILVTRAGSGSGDSGYQGVFFIVSQYSPFEHSLDELKQYYYLDATASSENALWGNSTSKRVDFVNYGSTKNTTSEDYNKRVSAITETVKSMNTNMSYQLFENTKKQSEARGVKVTVPSSIQKLVDTYISTNEAKNNLTASDTFNSAWQTYLQALSFNESTLSLTVPLTEGIGQFNTGSIYKYWDTTKGTSSETATSVLNPVYTKTN